MKNATEQFFVNYNTIFTPAIKATQELSQLVKQQQKHIDKLTTGVNMYNLIVDIVAVDHLKCLTFDYLLIRHTPLSVALILTYRKENGAYLAV